VGPRGRRQRGQPDGRRPREAGRGGRQETDSRHMLTASPILDRELDRSAHAREGLPVRGPPLDQLRGLIGLNGRSRRWGGALGGTAADREDQRKGDSGSTPAPPPPPPPPPPP